jgi:hypothetical protein
MFPIPDPNRLFPPRLPPSRSYGFDSLSAWLLSLGALPIPLVAIIVVVELAHNSFWLAALAGLVGWFLLAALFGGPIIVRGLIETIFYAGATFLLSDGLDRADPTPAWIRAGIVAAFLLGVTYMAWKRDRE